MSGKSRRAAMNLDGLDWNSFRDIATPEAAAVALCEFYGSAAVSAAANAAAAALADDRIEDARFWVATRAAIRVSGIGRDRR